MSFDDDDVARGEDKRSSRFAANAAAAGKRIDAALAQAGWTQADLARKTGVDKSQVSRIITGKYVEVSVGPFFAICEALALDPVYVWTGRTKRGELSPPPPAPEQAKRPASVPPPASERRRSDRPKNG